MREAAGAGATCAHAPSIPADLVVDRADTAFWVDEYGDIVGSVHADDAGVLRNGARWRPTERQSLTDAPMVTDGGDLWFAETAAAQLTRVRGVSAGRPRPARTARLSLDTDAATLRAEGLREMTSVDVRVQRDGATAGRASGLGVDAGGFALGGDGAAWDERPSGGLRPGDRVTVTPRGPHAPAPVSVTVPELSAAVAAGGTVSGTARLGTAAVAGAVQVQVGEAAARASVDPADASFATTLGAAAPGARGDAAIDVGHAGARRADLDGVRHDRGGPAGRGRADAACPHAGGAGAYADPDARAQAVAEGADHDHEGHPRAGLRHRLAAAQRVSAQLRLARTGRRRPGAPTSYAAARPAPDGGRDPTPRTTRSAPATSPRSSPSATPQAPSSAAVWPRVRPIRAPSWVPPHQGSRRARRK